MIVDICLLDDLVLIGTLFVKIARWEVLGIIALSACGATLGVVTLGCDEDQTGELVLRIMACGTLRNDALCFIEGVTMFVSDL